MHRWPAGNTVFHFRNDLECIIHYHQSYWLATFDPSMGFTPLVGCFLRGDLQEPSRLYNSQKGMHMHLLF